ncbi:hypothetical protein TNCV_1088491 [Trichonephila clavipes]|uniref:Uncharacterized protein n=1 Tax=Trichonephila clavipes TaxID=2585209 RepID=A0A8X6T296_TRICX|nr:hypothetical protein TNCV_1088491 [Trichonephila clavipes]
MYGYDPAIRNSKDFNLIIQVRHGQLVMLRPHKTIWSSDTQPASRFAERHFVPPNKEENPPDETVAAQRETVKGNKILLNRL